MKASDIKPEPITWLWYPYIPLGKITLLAGQMGQAKSLFTMWLTALVSNGAGLNLAQPSKVLVLSAEDDPADTIVPRLEAAGANLENVWVEPAVTLDIDHIGKLCDSGDVRLITIDPITAYLGPKVDSWKTQSVRAALEPLRQLAADRKVAIVVVQHLNRRSDAGNPLARIADSQGIPQLARSVLVWGPDPADPEGDHGTGKALTRAKTNLARANASAMFTIEERTVTAGIVAPTLVRGGDQQVRAEDVIADAETRSAVDEAAEFLTHLLAGGPVEAKLAKARANEAGITGGTLDRGKKRAGVVSEPSRDESKVTGWTWRLSDKTLGDVGDVGDLGDLDPTKGTKGTKNPKVTTPVHDDPDPDLAGPFDPFTEDVAV